MPLDPLTAMARDHFMRQARENGLDETVALFSSQYQGMDLEPFIAEWQRDRDRIVDGWPLVLAAGKPEWYPGPLPNDRHWPALKQVFIEEGWDDDRLRSVDDSSNKVVAHTPQPHAPHFASRGLVVGYVQSGKTTNFMAVAAKMVDVDYKFILVLSGIHNGLRRQTQERLEQQLTQGNKSTAWVKLTDLDRDFHKPTQSHMSLFGSSNQVVLAVVKKNADVLRRLVKWLDMQQGRQALGNAPVLIIDDEADQASVATSSINPLITKLLGLMPRHTYIGYTATPFANVFIDPSNEQDLYPRDFILNLPRPDAYFGPEQVFGKDSFADDDEATDGHDMVRRIPDGDVALLRPGYRDSAEDFLPTITGDVREALRWFWMATAARRVRGQGDKHSTMLIHTSVKTAVHASFEDPLSDEIRRHRKQLRNKHPQLLHELRNQWESETQRVDAREWGRSQNSFDEILTELEGVLDDCEVFIDNSLSESRIDYSGDPVVAIAVGGNTLSRGLTLEGLVVSLFVRGARQYDTLLQMGRWFGYRTGYEDLPRIWTTKELELAFRHLSQVEMEMRQDIERYQHENKTPMEVAVRIRTHPLLQITQKMGAAGPAEISYAGSRLQTRYFNRLDTAALLGNLEAASRLVSAAANQSPERQIGQSRHVVYEGVDAKDIKQFFSDYRFHEKHPELDTKMLTPYINQEIVNGALAQWNVVVIQGSVIDTVSLGPLQVHPSIRARIGRLRGNTETETAMLEAEAHSAETADIKTLMSKRDIGYDLVQSADELSSRITESELVRMRREHPTAADRGLVVLYVIDKGSSPQPAHRDSRIPLDAVEHVVGCGIVFPGTKESKRSVNRTHMSVDLSTIEEVDRSEFSTDHGASDV
ncbi:Z1 domain-containing protein [Micrococcus luteus]|nr:Z1 domain-containing protein [Micrococcus luteus]